MSGARKIVFGAISLDLFAVLLGGATALLPVFARDVLHVGAEGFGLLRAAPAIGATVVALYLAREPIRRHAGPIMFWGVAVIRRSDACVCSIRGRSGFPWRRSPFWAAPTCSPSTCARRSCNW